MSIDEDIKIDEDDINRYVTNYGANARLIGSLVNYAEKRCPVGDALTGLLENDLRKFVGHADTVTMADLDNLFKFAYNVLPSYCWGSKDRVTAHLTGEDNVPK